MVRQVHKKLTPYYSTYILDYDKKNKRKHLIHFLMFSLYP